MKRPCKCVISDGSNGIACMPEDVSFAISSSSFIMRRRVAIVGSVADEMRGERRNRGGTQSSCRLDGGSGGGSRGEEGSCLG